MNKNTKEFILDYGIFWIRKDTISKKIYPSIKKNMDLQLYLVVTI